MNAIITDYDYTLSDKFMTVELLHLLEELGVTKSGYSKEFNKIKESYFNKEKSYDEFVDADMALIKKYLKGVEYTKFLKVLREDFKPEENLFDWSKNIREIFPKEEWMFIVVSSTIGICLEQLQDVLDFDTYFASSYEVKNKVFTGEFSSQVRGQEKTQFVAGLQGNFEKTIVVGDAPADFGMMKFATSAFLFEPKDSTLKEAKGIDLEVVDRENILEKLKEKSS